MSGRLAGKVAIVTASTDGIGLAIAEKLALDGAAVVISSRKQQNVDKAVQQLRNKGYNVYGLVCHVGKKDHREKLIQQTIEHYGKLDILVSNAATNPTMGMTIETTEDVYDKIMDVNVKATFFLIQEAVPHIEKQKGSIVIVSSLGGYRPSPFLGIYSVSKTTLLGLTQVLATELASKDIRVNCIAPGLIKTKFARALWENETAHDHAVSMIPMQRIGLPHECAGAVAFLASDDASYITGETIVMAGGSGARL